MGPFVVGSIAIQCSISGQGPALVLLHGFGGQPAEWKAIEKELAQNFTVIVPSLGPLFFKERQMGFSRQVQVLQQWLVSLHKQYGPIHLAGASFGGAFAWALRAQVPELLGKVIMINPMPPNPVRRFKSRQLKYLLMIAQFPSLLAVVLKSSLGKKNMEKIAETVRSDWALKKQGLNNFVKRKGVLIFHLICQFAYLLKNENWSVWEKQLSSTGPETLLVFGQQDNLFSLKTMRWLAGALGSQTVLLDSGHMAVRTHSQEITQKIKPFLLAQACELAS